MNPFHWSFFVKVGAVLGASKALSQAGHSPRLHYESGCFAQLFHKGAVQDHVQNVALRSSYLLSV